MLGLKPIVLQCGSIAGIAKHLPECHAKDFSRTSSWVLLHLKCPPGRLWLGAFDWASRKHGSCGRAAALFARKMAAAKAGARYEIHRNV
jgi:hypothetical protein